MRSVTRENPSVGWNLIIKLLPKHHSSSSKTHRPKWREYVPEDWKDGVTHAQRWEDEAFYADLALELAGDDSKQLGDLLDFYFYIHPDFSDFSENYRLRLISDNVMNLPDEKMFDLWSKIATTTSNHRKYSNSDAWKVSEKLLSELENVAEQLKPKKPQIEHRRLFSGYEMDLYEETSDWDKQREVLLQKRIKALLEIQQHEGVDGLKKFWKSVESPNEVGNALSLIHI